MLLGGLEERVLAHGPFTLLSWTAPGNGEYMHNSSTPIATGRGSIAMMAGFAAARAIGNSARRREAKARAQPRWLQIDQGTVSVSNFGFYLHGPHGLAPWSWSGVRAASLTAPGQLSIDGMSESGPVKWLLNSHWAELVFLLWASVCSPHHPQLTGRTWLPEEWLTKAMVFTMENTGYPDIRTFREIVGQLR